ncbi:MAG: hypothetical protein ACR5KV_04800 [Wolbachia sp.]
MQHRASKYDGYFQIKPLLERDDVNIKDGIGLYVEILIQVQRIV